MAAEYERTDALRGARFTDCDATGMRFRDCDLSGFKAISCMASDLRLSGEFTALVVNDVDVTDYVAAELDRRFPERVTVRQMRTADDYRAAWHTIVGLWADTLALAERLPESARYEQVDEEWSLAETLRHLVFATDLWVRRMMLDLPDPFHPLGLPPTDFPPYDHESALDADAQPSYAEVLEARLDRLALMSDVVERLQDEELEHTSTRELPAAWEEPPPSVAMCLTVVMKEEVEHRRYMVRDMATLLRRQRAGS